MSRSIWCFPSINIVYLLMAVSRFLLVSLNIKSILGAGPTPDDRKNKLEEIGEGGGLDDAYMATLKRLKAQEGYRSKLGMDVLMWVLYSERPLRAEELCHALGVKIGYAALNPPTLRTLLESCQSLVTVEESSSTVRFVHYTLQEYLTKNPTLFHSSHSSIAEVCLTYLDFRCLRDYSPTPDSPSPAMPLEEYAACYWVIHARRGEVTKHVKELALRLLNRQGAQFGRQFVNPG